MRRRCVVCNVRLRVFETNLCKCGKLVCMRHKNRAQHDCGSAVSEPDLVKVVCPKINKI